MSRRLLCDCGAIARRARKATNNVNGSRRRQSNFNETGYFHCLRCKRSYVQGCVRTAKCDVRPFHVRNKGQRGVFLLRCFSCVWCGLYAWTLSAAHTEPRQVLWLKRAATSTQGSVILAAHRASLYAMCWRIGADQWCDGGTGNVVAELPWRVQIWCTNEPGRRLLAWAHHRLRRGRFYCVRRAPPDCKLLQNHDRIIRIVARARALTLSQHFVGTTVS